jgi:hypothetical protein
VSSGQPILTAAAAGNAAVSGGADAPVAGGESDVLLPALAPDRLQGRLGPVRRVLFFGKSMSRSRCTGALVDAFERHGVDVRWRNLVTLRRWFGNRLAIKLARAEFRRYRPDVVFVFYRDLPVVLADEFRRTARLVIWCEEALEVLDGSIVDYFRLADLVCMSNPARFSWLRERGVDNMAFLMSGFSPRYHRAWPVQPKVRDVAFIGGPTSSACTGSAGASCIPICGSTGPSTIAAMRASARRRGSCWASTRSTRTTTTSAIARS